MTTTFDSQLTRDTMRRIHFIAMLRRVLNPEIVKGFVLASSIAIVTVTIHIGEILKNMSHLSSTGEYATYIMGAYMHTSLLMQSFMFVACALGIWMVAAFAMNTGLLHRLHIRSI